MQSRLNIGTFEKFLAKIGQSVQFDHPKINGKTKQGKSGNRFLTVA
jgi:hypothetical protein